MWPDTDRDYANVHFLHKSRLLIAFTGRAGAGKSTAAARLVNRYGFKRMRFAEPLKWMLSAIGLTPDEIDGHLKEQPCTLLGGKSPRHAMQALGTAWGRDSIDPDLWVRAWQLAFEKLPTDVPVVIDDCRFPNEVEAIRANQGVLIRIDRPGSISSAAGHVSESHTLPADLTIQNDRDLTDLFRQVDTIASGLRHRCQTKIG